MNKLILEREKEIKLPLGWAESSLEEIIFNIIGGDWGNPISSKIPIDYVKVRVIRSTELKNWETDKGKTAEFRLIKKSSLDKRRLQNGNILLEVSGGSTTFSVGRTVLITNEILSNFKNPVICSNFFRKISLHKQINPVFVSYFLLYKYYQGFTRINKKQTVNIQNLNVPEYISKLILKISPSQEQKRIVEKIEERFSELDNAKNILEKNKLQLKQYRESLLKSAFEGKLTKKWREVNKTNLDIVLKKIELGRKSQDKKLQNIEPDKDSDFFMIPKEWKWIKVGIISKEIQYGTSEKATTTKSKIPVLRMGNIQDGELNFDNLKYYPENWKNFKQFLLEEGDILFNRTNSAELVGKTAVYRDYHPTAVFAGYLIRVKIIEETYIPYLLSCYVNSIFGKSYIKSVVTQQVGQANVNATKLSMMSIPLMSFEEQKEIISQLELGFSLIKNTENITNSMLLQLDTLRSSILKLAFEGKLVPQDLDDESAEILLEKIKQEKEQLKQKEKSKKRKKNGR